MGAFSAIGRGGLNIYLAFFLDARETVELEISKVFLFLKSAKKTCPCIYATMHVAAGFKKSGRTCRENPRIAIFRDLCQGILETQ